MNWYEVYNRVQSSGDPRRMAYLMAAMWAAAGDGPEWALGNLLMNTYQPFNIATTLDGAGVGLNREARLLLGQ